jgi:hypothetical protein
MSVLPLHKALLIDLRRSFVINIYRRGWPIHRMLPEEVVDLDRGIDYGEYLRAAFSDKRMT